MSQHTLGILGLAQGEVAFDVASLREVVSLEQPPAPMPRAPSWLIGSFSLRGVQIPTVDLAALLNLPCGPRPDGAMLTVAVLANRGCRFAVLVDRVGDVISVDAQALNALAGTDSDARLFAAHVFCRPGADKPVYVLDIEALLDLDDMVYVSDEAGRDARAARTGNYARTATRRRAVIASSGNLTLAVDADVVREIADCHTLDEPAVAIAGYLGNHRLRGDTVPVFDARVLMGQSPATSAASQMVVLDTGQGNIALAVEHILSMVDYQPQDCLPLAGPSGHSSDQVLAGLLSRPDMPDALMLSHAALFAREELANIARVHAELNHAVHERKRNGVAWRRFAFLHFEAAGEFVVLLDQLEAVLSMPAQYSPLGHAGVFEGVFRHLDQLVTLVDLRRLLGRPTSERADCQVLVVAVPAGRIGFMVDSAHDIEYIEAPSDSLHVHRRGSDDANPTLAQGHHCLTSVGEGSRKQYLSLLCLQALAAQLLGDQHAPQDSVCTPARFDEKIAAV
jgi:chemotaxis signal transduction protein